MMRCSYYVLHDTDCVIKRFLNLKDAKAYAMTAAEATVWYGVDKIAIVGPKGWTDLKGKAA